MFDEEKAKRTVDFIGCLKHTKGKWRGQPFELLPWQETVIRDVFGTVKENGYRQYNTAYVEIPKKNGKSELAAGVALYMTCGDNEWGAEVYGCASDRQQASIVFDVAVDMVEQCPALKKRIKPVMSVKRLVYKPTNSFYQVLSAEAYTKHGLNVHAVIFDELHSQPNRELFDVMTKGSGDARTQPLFFLITTAGTDRHSVCFEQHQKAEDILQGRKVAPTFYPVIYGASDDADWSSEDVWRKANPSLGHTIDIEKVRNAYLSAKDNPAEENIFRQLRLNQWVKQSTRWMQMEKWDACAFPVDEREVLGRECYGGLDLSSSIDITAFVLVFPPRNDTEKYILLPYFWIPEENMRLRVRRDHVPYDVWEKQGFLHTTEGNVIHYGFIENFIDDLGKKFHIKEIAFDRWGAVQMVQNLEGLGFTVVPFGQGFKDMSPPTKRLMELVLEKNIAHGGHPVLRWMMDNIFVRTDPAGNIKPDKEKSTEKIDGAVATIMGLDRAIRNEGSTGSVYDERGILSFKEGEVYDILIAQEVNMDEKDNVTEQLKELMEAYDFNVDTLSKYLGLPADKVRILAQGDISFLPEDNMYRFRLFNKISFLYLSATEDKDLKLCAFLQVLISHHGLSKKTIAKMAGIDKSDIEKMLSNPPRKVSEEIKYKVAVTVMSLRFFLKECEPEQ